MINILPKEPVHNHATFLNEPLPTSWNDLQKDKFWCNDANFGLLQNPGEVKHVSQDGNTGTCTISVNNNNFEYTNCDCSNPGKYNFKDDGRFLTLRSIISVNRCIFLGFDNSSFKLKAVLLTLFFADVLTVIL